MRHQLCFIRGLGFPIEWGSLQVEDEGGIAFVVACVMQLASRGPISFPVFSS